MPGPHLEWTDKVWHHSIPAKQGAFLWRVFQSAVPVDKDQQEIMKKGIIGPSGCNCCDNRKMESINHLFLHSDIASSVWGYFGKIIARCVQSDNLLQFFNQWMTGWNLRSQGGITALGIFGNCVWEIWRSRCKARFEDRKMSSAIIIKTVLQNCYLINQIIAPKTAPSKWDSVMLDRLGIPVQNGQFHRISWMKWNKPPPGRLKLNIDGSYKEQRGSIGGIFRDEEGIPIFAFWATVNTTDSDDNEMEAINRGIEICKLKGFHDFDIETDSASALRAYQGKSNSHHLVYKARNYQNYAKNISLVKRQQNRVADILAKHGRTNADAILSLQGASGNGQDPDFSRPDRSL